MRALLLLGICSAAGLFTCHAGPGVEPAPVTATAPVTSDASPAALEPDAAVRAEDAGHALEAVSDAKLFGCGRSKCRVGSESCCSGSGEGACVPTVPPGPHDKIQLLASQGEECGKITLPYEIDSIARCDESIDCGPREICCHQFTSSTGSATLCVAEKPSGATPCDFGERCVEGSPCRLKGTVCTRGYCRKPVPQVRCGKATCSAATPACCGDPPTCQGEADCENGRRIACTRPSDCIAGEHCQLSPGGAWCTGFLDIANSTVACERDADCPDVCVGLPHGKTRCLKSEYEGIKGCRCP